MRRWLGSAILFVAWLPVLPAAAQGRTTYCCTDERGVQVCSDVLPKACYGRAYREISPQGITVRRVEAPLTAEQRAAREAEERRAREEEARRREEERRNRALLATYTSEKDIDAARDRTVADIERAVRVAQEKLAELEKQKKKLEDEAEFYRKGTLPAALQAQMKANETERKTQQAVIAAKQEEIAAARARYEEEKQRYRELTERGTGAGAARTSGAAPAR